MNQSLLASAFCATLLLIGVASGADGYETGRSVVGFQADDQHGTHFTFKPGDARYVIFDTPDGRSTESPSDPDWFEKHQALLVVNLSEFSGLKRRIARSRVESKPFRILVVLDKKIAARFPRQKEKLTVLVVDEKGIISDIRYPAPGKELHELLTGGNP